MEYIGKLCKKYWKNIKEILGKHWKHIRKMLEKMLDKSREKYGQNMCNIFEKTYRKNVRKWLFIIKTPWNWIFFPFFDLVLFTLFLYEIDLDFLHSFYLLWLCLLLLVFLISNFGFEIHVISHEDQCSHFIIYFFLFRRKYLK